MNRQQVSNFMQFLHNRIESTNVLPIPSISWVDVPTQQLRQAWRALPVIEIESLPPEELENNVSGLLKVVSVFNHRLPHLTRAALTEIDTWLNHGN